MLHADPHAASRQTLRAGARLMDDRDTSFPVESRLTPDALSQLHHVALSRRRFLEGSGALIVAFAAGDLAAVRGVALPASSRPRAGNTPQTLDAWISIDASGHVTAYTGRAELGQGMSTVQTQLVAEELSVPISRITLVQCDTAVTPDQGTSSGSQAHPVNFNHDNLALCRCHRPRSPLRHGVHETRRAHRTADGSRWGHHPAQRCEPERDVRGAHRGPALQHDPADAAPGGSRPARGRSSGHRCPASIFPTWSPVASSSSRTFACPTWSTGGS